MRCSRFFRRLMIALGLGLLVLHAVPVSADPASEKAATVAAQSWLKLIDAGKYAEGYRQAAPLLKGQVNATNWDASLKSVRGPLGAVRSRKFKSATYATTLPGAPAGKYVVIQFDTSFDGKSATETVTPMLCKDGKWRVSGYYIR